MNEPFRDKLGRKISFLELDRGIQALFEGESIAELKVVLVCKPFSSGRSSTSYILDKIEVQDDFCRKGLGLELLACAKEWFYPLTVPESGTAAYLGLIAAAKRKGLLLQAWPKEQNQRVGMRSGNPGLLDR